MEWSTASGKIFILLKLHPISKKKKMRAAFPLKLDRNTAQDLENKNAFQP